MNDADKQKPSRTRRRRFLPVFAVLPLLLLLFACFARYDGYTFPEWWRDAHSGVVRWRADAAPSQAASEVKQVALTFDDGPDPRYTPRVLDTLRHYNIQATFFVEGRFMRAHPDLARRIIAEGHVLGNHTDTHPYLDRQSADVVRAEIDGCDRTLQTTLHLRTFLFRPPRGQWNPTIYREVRKRGDHLILWTVALEHHDAPTPPEMAARALRLVRPGGIILLHDGGSAPRDATVAALPLLLDGLRTRGYRCVTVPELLHIPGNTAITTKTTK